MIHYTRKKIVFTREREIFVKGERGRCLAGWLLLGLGLGLSQRKERERRVAKRERIKEMALTHAHAGVMPNRPHDYIYDSTFTVSSRNDHVKQMSRSQAQQVASLSLLPSLTPHLDN
jgi:hypothetical protein